MILERDAFTVEYDESITTLEDMYLAIEGLGYAARLAPDDIASAGELITAGEIPQPIFDALALARAQNKPVFVDFYAEWCIACVALDQQTLQRAEVQSALENYVVIKVDTDEHPESAIYYGVVGMPTLLILDFEGVEQYRSLGPVSAEELSQTLQSFTAE